MGGAETPLHRAVPGDAIMLGSLSVRRFKSLVDVQLDFARVNVFIGANGSGKSNLLEALGVLGAAASGRVDDETLLRRGVRPGVPRLYKTAFPRLSNVPHIAFGAESVEGARLDDACGDSKTRLPPGVRVKDCQEKDRPCKAPHP